MDYETREFHLGHILSITTDYLLAIHNTVHPIHGVKALLDFMTNDNLQSHQLVRAADECEPYLLKQHPQLADVEVPEGGLSGLDHVRVWLAEQVATHGEFLPVTQIPRDDHERINPVEEYRRKKDGDDSGLIVF